MMVDTLDLVRGVHVVIAGKGAERVSIDDSLPNSFDVARETKGLGLLGAAERAAALGGTLQIESRPGSGTRLRLQLPLRATPP